MSNTNPAAALLATRLAAQQNETKDASKPATTEEVIYQEYRSARLAQQVITDKGIKCVFNGHRFFTNEEETIAYLDAQIKAAPMLGVTKGDLVPSSARDPNKAHLDDMRAKIEAEVREKIMRELAGQTRDFGNYEQAKSGAGATTSETMIGSGLK